MKLRDLHERADGREARRYAYIAKNAPSEHEIGWLGHEPGKKFRGDPEKVQIKFDPADPEIQEKYVYHTHPVGPEGPNPLMALPSSEDLVSSVNNAQRGLAGIVIYHGDYYTVVVPTNKIGDKLHTTNYENTLQRGDIEDAIRCLGSLGFDIETGQL